MEMGGGGRARRDAHLLTAKNAAKMGHPGPAGTARGFAWGLRGRRGVSRGSCGDGRGFA